MLYQNMMAEFGDPNTGPLGIGRVQKGFRFANYDSHIHVIRNIGILPKNHVINMAWIEKKSKKNHKFFI